MIAVKGGNGSGKNYRPATHFLQEKQMATRIYKVNSGTDFWLVRASTRSQALAAVASKTLTVDVATQEELVEALTGLGARVIDAKESQPQLNLGEEQ